MKRLVMALSILAVLGMISPGLPTLAQPARVPHENPATATGSLDKVALLLSYSQVINLANSRQYQDARDIINELGQADIPDELRYIIDRYSSLYRQLINTLDNLESRLDEASTRLAGNRIDEARQYLDHAEVDIQNAGSLLEDISLATDTLSQQLGVFASPATSRVMQAHTRLEEGIERLSGMIDEFNKLAQGLTESYVQMMELMPTELSLSVKPASVFVGDSITAAGRLSADGKPLAGRKLSLTLDDQPIAATATRFDGTYVTGITIPYSYNATMALTTAYEPSGEDTDKYLAGKSPPLTINTMFYPTRLEVAAPETVHPGLPFAISGRVSSSGGNIDRTVSAFLGDTRLAEATVSDRFSLEAAPPEETLTGNHTLTVAVTPQGRYAGASESRTVNISRLPLYIDTQMPALVLLPQEILISGRVYHELGPVPGAMINLDFRDSSGITSTSPDGTFAASLQAPLDLSLVGPQAIMVNIETLEPWPAALKVTRQVFTINPLSTGLTLAILMALGLLVSRRSQTRVREEKGVPQAEVIALPATTPATEPRPGLTGVKGKILSAYREGLEAVAKTTDAGMAPSITLREFLGMAMLPSPTAISQFAELTIIAENALYSARSPREDTAARAEQLAATIKEELHHGTS